MERGLRAKTKVIDESFQISDEDCKLMMDYLKSTGEAYKSIHKKIEERLANDDGTRYTTEDVIRMREEKKLEREFKAKDWI